MEARKIEVRKEIETTLRPFYCEPCGKQYSNVAQHMEHLQSWAHHHCVVRPLPSSAHPGCPLNEGLLLPF